ncbi:hypothetical protein QT711_11160 [Sporosarcina saromensis]|uniref:Uncharacterized protein n=1 Tax=Sporosarcina saromensis TaxID=359365 RepID=A0ABU4G9W8_9BACL|nr:hypothetical protein [Sporosarcina saromensis]MDW0113746.1 hypothetical protein [Sporosarcina saromensis]
MWKFQLSDVNCLVCKTYFINWDVAVMEEGELPICELCIIDMCAVKVQYDGSQDLLEFLTNEVDGRTCPGCLESAIELHGISYGSTVWGDGRCRECNQGWSLEIHIEFV